MSARSARLRVGLLVLGATLVLMAALFLIGQQNRLFASKNRYYFTAGSVAGLNEGAPVRLNGVTAGIVEKITLPEDVHKQLLTIRISIERQYEERIRLDSTARIRTLGLLGDKYVDVTSGSPKAAVIPPGGAIPTAPDTDVDKLIASGGDVVDNMVRISYSLSRILDRVDRGEGLVGELTSGGSEKLSDRLDATLASAQRVMEGIERGNGPLGRIVRDEKLGDQLASAVGRLDALMASANRDDNLVGSLLHNPQTRADFDATLAEAKQAATSLRQWTAAVEKNDSVANRLLTDEEMGKRVGADLETLVHDLSSVAAKLDRGNGAAGMFINDPRIYDAVNHIIIGVNESRMLRWLIRNRQKKGIKARYEAEGGPPLTKAEEEAPDAEPAGTATATPPSPMPTAPTSEPAPSLSPPQQPETRPAESMPATTPQPAPTPPMPDGAG
ncbi:MAG TPA: MlaD family protein [Thermoanaerobaculia bacterium]|nr:MlaD family protein [Thermoanaerobaculia bacterium]